MVASNAKDWLRYMNASGSTLEPEVWGGFQERLDRNFHFRCRRALRLYFQDGWTIERIAEALGVSEKTIQRDLQTVYREAAEFVG